MLKASILGRWFPIHGRQKEIGQKSGRGSRSKVLGNRLSISLASTVDSGTGPEERQRKGKKQKERIGEPIVKKM